MQEEQDIAHAFQFLEGETGLIFSEPLHLAATTESDFILQRLAMEQKKNHILFVVQIKHLMANFLWHVHPVMTSASIPKLMKVNVITEISHHTFYSTWRLMSLLKSVHGKNVSFLRVLYVKCDFR